MLICKYYENFLGVEWDFFIFVIFIFIDEFEEFLLLENGLLVMNYFLLVLLNLWIVVSRVGIWEIVVLLLWVGL